MRGHPGNALKKNTLQHGSDEAVHLRLSYQHMPIASQFQKYVGNAWQLTAEKGGFHDIAATRGCPISPHGWLKDSSCCSFCMCTPRISPPDWKSIRMRCCVILVIDLTSFRLHFSLCMWHFSTAVARLTTRKNKEPQPLFSTDAGWFLEM